MGEPASAEEVDPVGDIVWLLESGLCIVVCVDELLEKFFRA